MTRVAEAYQYPAPRTALGLYTPPVSEAQVARWKIDGYPAVILIWTSEEWEKLSQRPSDAQFYPCGVWCALRME
jgi:hypothetical protein